MSVESIGSHNQVVTSSTSFEKNNGDVEVTGDAQRLFLAASVAKLYLAAAIVSIHHEGDYNLQGNTKITLREFLDGNYGTGRLRFAHLPTALGLQLLRAANEKPVTFRPIPSLKLLKLMITRSDNLATLVLANRVGREQIQQVLTFWGMKDTSVYNPKIGSENQTTAEDVHKFLHDFSSGLLIPESETSMIKDWMPTKTRKNPELNPITIKSQEGKTSSTDRSFFNLAGFIQGSLGENIFVILTESQAAEKGRIPYSQQVAARQYLDEIINRIP